MKLFNIYKFIIVFFFASGLSGAISIGCTSGDGEGTSSISTSYNLDSSTGLAQSITLGDDWISSSQSAEGSGTNKITQTAGNNEASVSSSLSSTGTLSSTASSYVSGDTVAIGHNVQAAGQSESTISGASGSNSAAQNAGVLDGAMGSFQTASAQSGTVGALQSWNIAGALVYSDGLAQSSDNIVKLTGGLNGVGSTSGIINTIASEGASASGSFQADSLESKAYSAVKSTSTDGDVYSYLSSADQLASSLSGSANGHVSSTQDLRANGDVLVHASSTSDDSSSKSYDAKGESVSGSLSASAGSPAVIETNLAGDIQSSTAGLIPTPGSWVWNDFGGIITSNPYQLKDDQGKSHTFVKGNDNRLWDNVEGDWQGLGGVITSDPYAVKDDQGKIHVLARGSDGSLWDRILDGSWTGLGGYITSNPSAALASDNHIKVAVRGGDNALWMKDLTTGVWSTLGGVITSNPQVIFDNDGKMHALVRGGEGMLWDNVDGDWRYRGSYMTMTSDARSVLNPFNPGYINTYFRGGDAGLWVNSLNVGANLATTTALGGVIASNSGSLNKGNPAPVVDTDGIIHTVVRGGDGALWDNSNGIWYNLGGFILSDPNAMRDRNGRLRVAVVGGDSGLWVNTIGINQIPTSLVGPIACDYNKIQPAISASNPGGIVKVLSSSYNEDVTINKGLILQGVGDPTANSFSLTNGAVLGPGTGGITAPKVIVNQGSKVQDGITLVASNGEVDVNAGIYNENIFINKPLTVKGSGIDKTIIDGQNAGSVFTIKTGGEVTTLVGLTIQNGNAGTSGGGGIYNRGGTLTLNDVFIKNNTATYGGGIYNSADYMGASATVILNGGSISNNTATYGGGIYNELGRRTFNMVTINDGSICYNNGCGIYNQGPGYLWFTSAGIVNLNGGSIDHNNGGDLCNLGTVNDNRQTNP
jgi:hypothetical protein